MQSFSPHQQQAVGCTKVRIIEGPKSKPTIVTTEPKNVLYYRRKHAHREYAVDEMTSDANGRIVFVQNSKPRNVREISKTSRHSTQCIFIIFYLL